jgi:hypothetical protein
VVGEVVQSRLLLLVEEEEEAVVETDYYLVAEVVVESSYCMLDWVRNCTNNVRNKRRGGSRDDLV